MRDHNELPPVTSPPSNCRSFRGALVAATVIEAIVISGSLLVIYEGGVHPAGALFAVLHFPSSALSGFIAWVTEEDAAFFMLLSALSQFLLFAVVVYWVQKLVSMQTLLSRKSK